MGFLDDLTEGIEQFTDVVEVVGEAAGATQKLLKTGRGLPDLNIVAAGIQAKINAGTPLTGNELSNKALIEKQGYVFTSANTYPLEYYSGAGSQPGIQKAGLLSDVVSAFGGGAAPGVIPAVAAAAAGDAGGLPVPWWKGPGGALQLPWNDPRIPGFLSQFAL